MNPSARQTQSPVQTTPSALAADFDCPEEFGYYPHPTDCSQYYVCVFGGALLESCTGGLMYSHELQTCDWPRNVGCDAVTSDRQQHQQYQSSRVQPNVQQPARNAPTQQPIYQRAPQQQQYQQPRQQQQQQQQTQQQPRIRFTTVASSVAPPAPFSPRAQPQQQQQQPQQQQYAQRFPPPPPELRIAPNPVITSRGQPKYVPSDEVSWKGELLLSCQCL